MKNKKIMLFAIGLITFVNTYAVKVEGVIILKNDSTIHAILNIPVKLISRDINFESIQCKIRYFNSANEKVILRPDQVREFRFKYKEQDVRMVSCLDNLNLLPIFSQGTHIFLQLKIDGRLKLYMYYYTQSYSTPNGSGGMVTTSYSTDKYILQKENGELFRPRWISFKKDMKSYLADCKGLVEKLEDKTYRESDIGMIVDLYNNCNN